MNYFAHGYKYLDDPYFLAGVSVPDWLSVVDRKARARSAGAAPFTQSADQAIASVAQGVIQHHRDDDQFHRTRAFAELSLQFTLAIRRILPPDNGFRPSFLGHILVELLLDDVLIQRDPSILDRYYDVMDQMNVAKVASIVNQITTRPAANLDRFIKLFSSERFLYDYAEDAKLLFRLNRVMCRVKLQELPDSVAEFFPEARAAVRNRSHELLI